MKGRFLYVWALGTAALLLLVIGVPLILFVWVTGRHSWFYRPARAGGRFWLRMCGVQVRVIGIEKLDPTQSVIFISNHRSYLDPVALLVTLKHRLGFIAKKELLRVPILGQGMRYVNAIAIDRGSSAQAIRSMQLATEKLRSGVSFVVFAEGTRAGRDQLLPFKKGGFHMAIEGGVPIVPVAIRGTAELMGKDTGEFYPGTIEVEVLPPIETKGLTVAADLERILAETHARISAALAIAPDV